MSHESYAVESNPFGDLSRMTNEKCQRFNLYNNDTAIDNIRAESIKEHNKAIKNLKRLFTTLLITASDNEVIYKFKKLIKFTEGSRRGLVRSKSGKNVWRIVGNAAIPYAINAAIEENTLIDAIMTSELSLKTHHKMEIKLDALIGKSLKQASLT